MTQGEVVAIESKTLRRSFRHAGDKVFIHMVSAWATANRRVADPGPFDRFIVAAIR